MPCISICNVCLCVLCVLYTVSFPSPPGLHPHPSCTGNGRARAASRIQPWAFNRAARAPCNAGSCNQAWLSMTRQHHGFMVWWKLRCSFGGSDSTQSNVDESCRCPSWAPSPPWLFVAAAVPRPSEVEAVHGPTGNVPPGAPDTWTMVSKDWETLMI